MKTIKIVGVPEHFNLPWHLCIEDGEFEAVGIDLQWTDIPEGTGKMCQMLRNRETDIAVILTEGIIKDITEGNQSKIVQVFIQSPLIWGIHVAAKSKFKTLSDIENSRVAISRMGSGSHLMSIVNAEHQNWNTEKLSYEIVNTIDGAVEALTNDKADYFMWERFMTQPLVDEGVFRRIGECPTPWPCFVIAVRNEVLEQHPKVVEQILDIINITTEEFKMIPSIDRTLASKFNQKLDAIQEWLKLTQWSQKQMNELTLDKILERLLKLQIIDKKLPKEAILK
ncbi:substrate-binding domain-containing protein [Flavobacterium sp.]|jgi:ABC-type nitrate/sulfonate/bicarbonate transport system substrate-binding protein|uniref:substrate-binding domain-containing protein n=1 Tax=Flavobacterium sp. TaxID=239 RepID=UPI0037BF4902